MIGLSVRVLPLLRKEVQMSDVRVEGLNLRLNRDKAGHGNWEDIGQPRTRPPPAPKHRLNRQRPPRAPNPTPPASRSNSTSTA
jgi:AsmA protein